MADDADAKHPYHEIVAERLIEQLKQGTAPWQRPWNPGSPASGMPFNPTTGKRYRGINAIWLMSQGFDDARWMTINQANSVGALIRKGEKSTGVQFWQFDEARAKTDEKGRVVRDENGDPLKEHIRLERPIRRFFQVFNAEQIDGLSRYERQGQTWDPIKRAQTILTASGANISHSDSSRAFYRPATDTIHLLHKGQFPSADHYYATALHELGHWTGHASRLGRDIENPFGSRAYAKEELRAEIASLLLGEELAIAHDPGQHAAYVASWIEALEEDPTEIFRAAADAEKIVDFMCSFEQKQRHATQSERSDPIPVELHPESTEADRIYIDVVYREKDIATALGAKWDRGQKSWYIPSSADPEPFARWPQAEPTLRPGQTVHGAPTPGADRLRLYLAVPYAERGDAKAAECHWDKEARSWYADPDRMTQEQLDVIAKWRLERVAGEQAPPMDPRQEFKETLLAAGFALKDPHPIMDGSKQRVPVDGDTAGERGGYYRAYLDGHPAGTIKNYCTGDEIKWVATGYRLSDPDRAKLQAEAANKVAEREEERNRTFEATAERVARQFAKLAPLSVPTPYLEAKGVALDPGVRTDATGTLFVPAIDADGKHWTTQYIKPDGQKRFAKDSRKEGCFYVTGGRGVEALKGAPRIVIAKGFATAKTLEDAVGYPVVTAFSTDNLKSVAEDLHARFPGQHVVIAGNDDRHLVLQEGHNRGREAAREAAAAVGGTALFPVFAYAEYRHPEGLKAITPETYRAHCQAKTALDRACNGEASLTEARRAEFTEALLSEPQLKWLNYLEQHSDFNDLARHSSMVRASVANYFLALDERLARNGHKVRLSFDSLNEQQQEWARNQFLDAKSGDGYVYEILPDWSVLSRGRNEEGERPRTPRGGDAPGQEAEKQKMHRKVRGA